jgi:AAA domain
MQLTRKRVDLEPERDIVTGLIVHRRYCKTVLPLIDLKYIQTEYAKTLIIWIKEYFEKFQKNPAHTIQKIFEEKKGTLTEIHAKLMEGFLAGLNEHYTTTSEDFDIDYQIAEAQRYLKARKIEYALDATRDLLTAGKFDEADEHLKGYSKQVIGPDDIPPLEQLLVTQAEAIQEDLQPPKYIIYPWLMAGTCNMVYADTGVGKTMLATYLAALLTTQGAVGRKINEWEVMSQTDVLYVDGEMGDETLVNQVAKFRHGLGPEDHDNKLYWLFDNRVGMKIRNHIDIMDSDWCDRIYDYVKGNPNCNLVILDNLIALAQSGDPDKAVDFHPIKRLVISLANLGASVIYLHHENKAGFQTGTKIKENFLTSNMRLTNVTGYTENDGCWFTVTFEKKRHKADPGFQNFSLHMVEEDSGAWTWEIGEKGPKSISKTNAAKCLLMETNWTQKRIARAVMASENLVKIAREEMEKAGMINAKREPRNKGKAFIRRMVEDYGFDLNHYLDIGDCEE